VPTATAEKTPTALDDLFLLLVDSHKTVAEVLGKEPNPKMELALAQAWARGDVEFGRISHCVTGRPGVPESKPTLIIESGIQWTGAKTPQHKRFSELKADAAKVPECSEYKKYVQEVLIGKDEQGVERWKVQPVNPGDESRWTTVKIQRPEAVALLVLYVQLTDKGLAAVQA
jgi:hypothetical protein